MTGDEVDEVGALEGRAVVGHDRQRLDAVLGHFTSRAPNRAPDRACAPTGRRKRRAHHHG